MIYDSIKNVQRYMHLNTQLDKALSHLLNNEWNELPDGRNTLDGDQLFANIDRYMTVTDKPLEMHKRYVDIQYMLTGEENIGIPASDELLSRTAYDEARDITFLDSKQPYVKLPLRPGQFLVLFPNEPHAPGMQLDTKQAVRKVIVKILWDEQPKYCDIS